VTNYNETLLGINALGDPYLSYDATGLFTGSLSAGTKYWLSIVATTGAAPPYWDWEAAAPGDGSFYYSSPAGAGLLPNGDFAFTLLGDTTAPEPGTLGILGLSLSFLGLIRRRTDNIQL
jgi:hypothetical protein